jgi:2-polyprenyl-6-methoxyphenol hydroxylase-like FAD-dependent oxidoreductase
MVSLPMSTSSRHVLIAGMGVAGLTIARLLRQDGWHTTLLERSSSLRMGGQPVDVRGPALDVMAQMGLLEGLQAARTRVRGMSIVDAQGRELERNTEWTLGTGQLESPDIEVLRDDIMGLLRQGTEAEGEEIFGDSVQALTQDAEGVHVSFDKAAPRRFDLVIGADGLHSRVRLAAFGPQARYLRHMGQYLSVFTGPNFMALDRWQIWYRSDDCNYLSFPVRDNAALRSGFWFNCDEPNRNMAPIEEQKHMTAERMQGLGGHVPRLIEDMWLAEDFYCSPIAQIHMDRYADGRVVLLGDACYCASPFAGQGTSLALIGAHVLATEMRQSANDLSSAFARYEQRMRPFVAQNQGIVQLDRADPGYLAAFDKAKSAIQL